MCVDWLVAWWVVLVCRWRVCVCWQVVGTVSPGIEPGYIVFPSHKNNVFILSKVYCYLYGKRKFAAVRRVGLMTRHEYRVDRLFPVTWLGNVWEPTPPPQYGLSRLFNPCFPGLKSDTVTLSHRTVIGIVVLTHLHLHWPHHPPTASSRLEHRVSVFPFCS